MTAFAGVFSDFKLIKTRSVAQLIIEIPIESADHALKLLGGVPQASKERWVGIAPLSAKPEPPARETAQEDPFEQPGQHGADPTRRFWDLPPAQQAALKCADSHFQKWLVVEDQDTAAAWVRAHCKVSSRSELNTNAEAAAIWRQVLRSYEDDRLGRR